MALGRPESTLQAALGSGRYGGGRSAVNRPVACSVAFLGESRPGHGESRPGHGESRPGHVALGRGSAGRKRAKPGQWLA
jgi:hypothetical protein